MPMMPVIAAKSKRQASREQDRPEQRSVVQVRIPGVAWAAWVILMVVSALVGIGLGTSGVPSLTLGLVVTAVNLLGLWVLFALKVADQWEKGVMLRLGRFTGLRGPGLFWIFPVVDRVSSWIDHRVTVTSFSAEKTLTKDTVPVDVDACCSGWCGMRRRLPWRWRTTGWRSPGRRRPRCGRSSAR